MGVILLLGIALAAPPSGGNRGQAHAASGEQSPPRRQIVFAVIADARGWIVPPPGGGEPWSLANAAGALRSLRGLHGDIPLLALGDWVSGAPAPSDPTPMLLRIAARLGVAAALPGEQDLVRMQRHPAAWANAPDTAWLASDVTAVAGTSSHAVIQSQGLRIGVIGLARPGVVTATRLRRAGATVLPAIPAARQALAALARFAPPDLTIALVNGARDGPEEQATALAQGVPARYGAHELADGDIPVNVLILRDPGRSREEPQMLDVNTVPVMRVPPGLGRMVLSLERRGGRWRVMAAQWDPAAVAEPPDGEILALAGDLVPRTRAWLAEPSRAAVSGPSRKGDFIACAGALVHSAAAWATSGLSGKNSQPFISLLPHLWRYEPLRKRHIGQAITRGRIYRWMPHDDALLPARLTGRQIALMLEPWARHRSGWTVPPALVLHPGGIEPAITGRATQPHAVRFAAGGPVLEKDTLYPVWLVAYHAFGAGGLARRALVQDGQLGEPGETSLREWVFRWMAGPEFTPPAPCRSFLALRAGDSGAASGTAHAPGRG